MEVRGLPLCLLAVTCAVPALSLGQGCAAQRMDNAIIDINLSLPMGIRGVEPVHISTPEACIHACCLGKKLSGDKKCNFVIFDAQRASTQPNCYLFHCPSTEACLMKRAMGLVSYKIGQDTDALEDTSFKNEDFHSNERSIPSDARTFISQSQASHQNRTTALQQFVFHQASEVLNHTAKHVDNTEFRTIFPESQWADNPKSLDPLPRQTVINPPPNTSSAVQIGNPSALFSTTQSSVPSPSSTTVTPLPTSTVRLKSYTTSLLIGGAKPSTVTTTTTFMLTARAEPGIPAASIAATHVLSSPTTSASTSTAKWVTSNPVTATSSAGLRSSSIPPEPTVVSTNYTSRVTFVSFSGFALSSIASPIASQNNHQDYDPSDSEGNLSENVQTRKGFVQLEDKSRLVAALLFGVIFLLLVIALMGKKMHESLQKRQYTRLDYLINGMYADV
ncbi:MANSC domain-containing protein 1 isoform X2 [Numida meleagris]|uniref:MANSC domain-containing protein 1 isoform X2 n=1 Tax=Numida meleagris TaxID=8996 RepID=UPI000B3D97D9|nr:MANSC domain-containing protein 1 isoform X2 [Numida meleagris]